MIFINIWEEKKYTKQQKKREKPIMRRSCVITGKIKRRLKREIWRDIMKTNDLKDVDNIEKTRLYYQKNKDKIIARTKKWAENNKDKVKEYKKLYKLRHREKILKDNREYFKKNKDKKLKYQNNYRNKRYKTDIGFKLKALLRRRLNNALNKNYKSGSAIKDLGCSIPELKEHLEKQFKNGMNWENWGYDGWHIDHIKPLSSFDLSDRKQFLEANHYTNLQPLWREDNLKKSDKIISG